MNQSLSILVNQPSFVDQVSHFLSPTPIDLINASSVMPSIRINDKKITQWDKNLSILQNLPSPESPKEMKHCNPNRCVESLNQGLRYAIKFDNPNRKLILFIQSIELPDLVKSITFSHEFELIDSNCVFKLIEHNLCLDISNQFERFIVSRDVKTKDQENVSIIIDVSSLESVSFLLEADSLFFKLKNDNFKFSQSGKIWYLSDQPNFVHRNGEMLFIKYPSDVEKPEIVGFLDDEWILWKSSRYTRINRTNWYLYNLDSKTHREIGVSSCFHRFGIYLVGKSFILIVSRLFKENQKSFLLNVKTEEKFKFKSKEQEVYNVYVVGSGIFKYNFIFDKNFVTFDVDSDLMVKIDN